MPRQLLLGQSEDFLEETHGFPTLGDVFKHIVVKELIPFLKGKVAEILQFLVTFVLPQVLVPLCWVGHGIEHLCQVLHVFIVGREARRHQQLHASYHLAGGVLFVCVRQLAQADPVAVALAGEAEGGTYTNPEVCLTICVHFRHHISEAVVGRTLERGVIAHLLSGLVDDLRDTRHLLDADIDDGE